jgi:GNAT superfamily N-acetyltransferase
MVTDAGGSDLKVSRMGRDRIPVASEVLARAFQDDPVAAYVIPDPHERARCLPPFYALPAALAERFGEAFVTGPDVLGAALWFPPGLTEFGAGHFQEVGAGSLAGQLPEGAFGRFASLVGYLDGLRRRDVRQPHWYLAILGVEPELQGRGIGGALMRPILDRCDRAQLPCYLETQKERNVPFYERHGFRVVVEVDEPTSGIRFWTMLREPHGASPPGRESS